MALSLKLVGFLCILFQVHLAASLHVVDVSMTTQTNSSLPPDVYFQDGDIILGGLFPLHTYDEESQECTAIREIRALKLVDAMAYAVGSINANATLLPGVQLGFEIYDSCYSDIWTLKKALNFMPPEQKRVCTKDEEGQWKGSLGINCLHRKRVAGVVGSQKSASSSELAILLGLYQIPQVSYLSTLDSLNEAAYPYFLRVVPSDRHQVNAIMDFIQYYEWTYISLLFSDDQYGENGYYEFSKQAAEHNICLAYTGEISSSFSDEYYDDIVADLRREPYNRAVVVVLFAHLDEARMLLRAVDRNHAVGEFTFVASDGIGNFGRQGLKGVEEAAMGMITMVPFSEWLPDFVDYFFRSWSVNSTNPWTTEYMETYTWCDVFTGGGCADNETDRLSPHETLVIDSVYAFAYALDSMLTAECDDQENLSNCILVEKMDGEKLLKYLKETAFESLSNGLVKFDSNGDGIARYKIRNLNKALGSASFMDVGSWEENHYVTDINKYIIRFYTNDTGGEYGEVPSSVCSSPCPLGSRKEFATDETKCCWVCVECDANATVVNDATECQECTPPEWPNLNRTDCVPVEASYMSWGTVEGIVVQILAGVAVLEALVVLVLYCSQFRRRIVRKSDPMLCGFILTGACLVLVAALSTTFRPSSAICVVARMAPSIAYALIFVPFALKSVRLYRVFIKARDTDSEEEADLWGPRRQLLILATIWAVQIGVSIAWILVFPPETRYTFVQSEQTQEGDLSVTLLVTCNFQLHETVTEMCFSVLLLLVTLTLSLLARALPDHYHEARFCVFASAGGLLVFVGAYAADFSTSLTGDSSYVPIMYRALGMSTTSILIMSCLFAPKMYVIYFIKGDIDEVMLKKRQSMANMAVYRARASTASSFHTLNGGTAGRRRSRARSVKSSSEPTSSSGDQGIEMKAITTSVI